MSGYEMWFRNGGIDTIKDLMFNYPDKLDEILEYLKLLPLVYKIEINHNIFYFAHANLSFSNGVPLKSQDRDFILWQRRRPTDNNIFEDNLYLITGHTITRNFGVDDIIFKSDSWYCIDCGAVFTGVLGCLRLDDFKEFYVSE
jgi:serine/threonine protein phosphatase 1